MSEVIAPEYHKIKTVWDRDPENDYNTLIDGSWARPEFELLKDTSWICEEKVDGTSCRVIWDGENVEYRGRRECSQLQGGLEQTFRDLLPERKFRTEYPDTPMCIYGEGYGRKIQAKGEQYIPDGQGFMAFDVRINGLWLRRRDVHDIAQTLGIDRPHVRWQWPLEEAIEVVANGFESEIAETPNTQAEGFICRPKHVMFDRRGRRIITKIKTSDFE